jgi:hypothetical protein
VLRKEGSSCPGTPPRRWKSMPTRHAFPAPAFRRNARSLSLFFILYICIKNRERELIHIYIIFQNTNLFYCILKEN